MHLWAVGIENACNLYAHPVLSTIIEKQGLCGAFSFIIARSRTDWIDVTKIGFRLGVNCWIPINLAGGCLENFCAHTLGKPKNVDSAVNARFDGLNRIELINKNG